MKTARRFLAYLQNLPQHQITNIVFTDQIANNKSSNALLRNIDSRDIKVFGTRPEKNSDSDVICQKCDKIVAILQDLPTREISRDQMCSAIKSIAGKAEHLQFSIVQWNRHTNRWQPYQDLKLTQKNPLP